MVNQKQLTAEIVMYSTQFCPYCVRARQLLQSKGLGYREIAVDHNLELRHEMMEKSGRRTVPQIWIGDNHIGGFTDLNRLESSGQLDQLVYGPLHKLNKNV